jgi:kumamolisin
VPGASGDDPLDLTLRLRPRSGSRPEFGDVLKAVLHGERPPLTRDAFAARFGAAPADLATVERWAMHHGISIQHADPTRRLVGLRAPIDLLARLFRVDPVTYTLRGYTWRSHQGPLSVPRHLARIVADVFGFDGRPLAGRSVLPQAAHVQRRGRTHSFSPPEVARLYGFPEEFDGRGQTVGVIALGGGYLPHDLTAFFKHLRLPRPRFSDVSVAGAHNAPAGRSRQFDGEVTGDIEMVGALVPAAHIVVYFAPNSVRGFFEAVAHAVHDARYAPSIISISWGSAEVHWARRTLRQFNEVLSEAAITGVTVCCSSGDHGAFADLQDRKRHVCFPASSPFALACGGTSLLGSRRDYLVEKAWSDKFGASGGGVSELLPRPPWQSAARVPKSSTGHRGRGVPDVAANGDPASGYRVFVQGKWRVGAGTSAAAPLWAGLLARVNQMRRSPVGLITPFLYRHAAALAKGGGLRPIQKRQGSRQLAARGWNRATGLGAPHGLTLAAAIERAFAALSAKRR